MTQLLPFFSTACVMILGPVYAMLAIIFVFWVSPACLCILSMRRWVLSLTGTSPVSAMAAAAVGLFLAAGLASGTGSPAKFTHKLHPLVSGQSKFQQKRYGYQATFCGLMLTFGSASALLDTKELSLHGRWHGTVSASLRLLLDRTEMVELRNWSQKGRIFETNLILDLHQVLEPFGLL